MTNALFTLARFSISLFVVLCVAVAVPGQARSDADASQHERLDASVRVVAPMTLQIDTPQGEGALPVYANRDINAAAPDVKQVFIVIHGTLRNADTYFETGMHVLAKAGEPAKTVMVVAPQFLTTSDAKAFSLSPQTLAWTQEGWKAGDPARQPEPISSFSALDALLAHFGDRRLYPALSSVVVIGHSAGAQLVQRYAVVGREGGLVDAGIAVRYVVANPSSYLYFDRQRPGSKSDALASCPGVSRWKYGLDFSPPYVSSQSAADLESRYVARKVVYLLGTADTNPYTHYIDRSCAAMVQGPNRLARGLTYFGYLESRHYSGFDQKIVEVPGIGHDNLGMFTSECGMAVLFDQTLPSSCPIVDGTTRDVRTGR